MLKKYQYLFRHLTIQPDGTQVWILPSYCKIVLPAGSPPAALFYALGTCPDNIPDALRLKALQAAAPFFHQKLGTKTDVQRVWDSSRRQSARRSGKDDELPSRRSAG
jgi:hypothetical protein